MISVQLINANLHKIQLKVSLVKERGKEEEAKEEEEEEEGVEKVEGESMKKIYDCSSTSQSPPPAISDLKSEYITRSNSSTMVQLRTSPPGGSNSPRGPFFFSFYQRLVLSVISLFSRCLLSNSFPLREEWLKRIEKLSTFYSGVAEKGREGLSRSGSE